MRKKTISPFLVRRSTTSVRLSVCVRVSVAQSVRRASDPFSTVSVGYILCALGVRELARLGFQPWPDLFC